MEYAAAGKRTTVVRQQRIDQFAAAKRRYRALRRAGQNATRIATTGGLASALWGSAVDGFSDAAVQAIRKTLGATTRCAVQSRSLTLDLALAGGAEADPFVAIVAIVATPIQAWANAIWSKAVSIDRMQLALTAELRRLAGAPRPWARVRGPTGVFVLSPVSIGWKAES